MSDPDSGLGEVFIAKQRVRLEALQRELHVVRIEPLNWTTNQSARVLRNLRAGAKNVTPATAFEKSRIRS